jgi:large subunit ribosomal protein L23
MIMDAQDIIKRPLHTEKSVEDITDNNRYHFEVDARATKTDVRRAVEELFPDVRVLDVNTLWMRGKQKRRRWTVSRTPDRKKAIVRLREGDAIDMGY